MNVKRIISIVLSLTISFLISFSTYVTAETLPVVFHPIDASGEYRIDLMKLKKLYSDSLDEKTLDEVISVYLNDSHLQQQYEINPNDTIFFISEGIHNLSELMYKEDNDTNTIVPYGGLFPNYTTDVTPVRQAKTYWCGPTAAVQALTGTGVYSRGLSNYDGAQQTMAQLMHTTTSGTGVLELKNAMNSRINAVLGSNAKKYEKHIVIPSTMDKYTLLNKVLGASIQKDRPCVTTVLLKKLPYYKGTSTGGHYITISAVKGDTGETKIVDPHYDNRYFGYHTLTYDQLRTILNGRYVIYTP